jgi:hypothetical protein
MEWRQDWSLRPHTKSYSFIARTNMFSTRTQKPARFAFGYVTQRTRAYQTPLDIQRGLLVQFTHKNVTFATQIFNVGQADPTVVLSLGYSF